MLLLWLLIKFVSHSRTRVNLLLPLGAFKLLEMFAVQRHDDLRENIVDGFAGNSFSAKLS